MSKMKRLKDVTVGVVLGGVLFSGVSYAASATNIDAYFLPLKYYFDGVEKKPADDQAGFIYNGTTYVPLRFMAEATGKSVDYEGSSYSVYVGKPPEGKITYMEEMKTITKTGDSYEPISSFETNMGERFIHGYGSGGIDYSRGKLGNEYILNGVYKKFEALLAPGSQWTKLGRRDNIGQLKVYADGNLVYDSGAVPSDITKPIKVSVDLTGVLKVKIEVIKAEQFGLLDAKFIN